MTRRLASMRRAGRQAAAFTLALPLLGGCYTYQPLAGPAPLGREVALEIGDMGRVRLGSSLGAFPLRVEGRLTATTDTSYTVSVQSVESVRGGTTRWTGDPVTLLRSDVATVRLKQLDRTRTTIGVVTAVGAIVAFVLTRSLIVDGNDGDSPRLPPGGGPGPST